MTERDQFATGTSNFREQMTDLSQQLAAAQEANREMKIELDATSDSCLLLRAEKEQLVTAGVDMEKRLEARRVEISEQKHLIGCLEAKLEETLNVRDSLEQDLNSLETVKVSLLEQMAALKKDHLDALSSTESQRLEFQSQLLTLEQKLEAAGQETARWRSESENLLHQSTNLELELERSAVMFQSRLEEVGNQLTQKDGLISRLQTELGDAANDRDVYVGRAANLEQEAEKLSAKMTDFQTQVAHLENTAETLRLEVQSEKQQNLEHVQTV